MFLLSLIISYYCYDSIVITTDYNSATTIIIIMTINIIIIIVIIIIIIIYEVADVGEAAAHEHGRRGVLRMM